MNFLPKFEDRPMKLPERKETFGESVYRLIRSQNPEVRKKAKELALELLESIPSETSPKT